MLKADPRPARKRQRSKGRPSARPTSKEHQQALDEIDTLRLELIRKDQTVAQLKADAELRMKTIYASRLEVLVHERRAMIDALHGKQVYAERLEYLLHERLTKIDELTGTID